MISILFHNRMIYLYKDSDNYLPLKEGNIEEAREIAEFISCTFYNDSEGILL